MNKNSEQQQLEALRQQMAKVVQLNREAAKKREANNRLLRQWAQS